MVYSRGITIKIRGRGYSRHRDINALRDRLAQNCLEVERHGEALIKLNGRRKVKEGFQVQSGKGGTLP
jgi:hypothetical protein